MEGMEKEINEEDLHESILSPFWISSISSIWRDKYTTKFENN
jgi:hypothetical protein